MGNIVTTGWIETSGWLSEKKIPSLWIGERNIKLGSKNNIDIILLYGYDKLETDYLSALEDVGYNVIDASSQYGYFTNKFKRLAKYVTYERNCFLRWPIIHELYGDEPIFHFDGDVVFNTIPETLNSKLGRFNFVLQGCPGICSISKSEWYIQYENELKNLNENIEHYSSLAWKERMGWEISRRAKWAGTRNRPIIGSDQDFISHLIHTERLIQDDPGMITTSIPDILMFQNPICIQDDVEEPIINYVRNQGIDFINSKKVAFWHMQNDFTHYLRLILIVKHILKMPAGVPNPINLSNCQKDRVFRVIHENLETPLYKLLPRKKICEQFFNILDFSSFFRQLEINNLKSTQGDTTYTKD